MTVNKQIQKIDLLSYFESPCASRWIYSGAVVLWVEWRGAEGGGRWVCFNKWLFFHLSDYKCLEGGSSSQRAVWIMSLASKKIRFALSPERLSMCVCCCRVQGWALKLSSLLRLSPAYDPTLRPHPSAPSVRGCRAARTGSSRAWFFPARPSPACSFSISSPCFPLPLSLSPSFSLARFTEPTLLPHLLTSARTGCSFAFSRAAPEHLRQTQQ